VPAQPDCPGQRAVTVTYWVNVTESSGASSARLSRTTGCETIDVLVLVEVHCRTDKAYALSAPIFTSVHFRLNSLFQ